MLRIIKEGTKTVKMFTCTKCGRVIETDEWKVIDGGTYIICQKCGSSVDEDDDLTPNIFNELE